MMTLIHELILKHGCSIDYSHYRTIYHTFIYFELYQKTIEQPYINMNIVHMYIYIYIYIYATPPEKSTFFVSLEGSQDSSCIRVVIIFCHPYIYIFIATI